MPSPEHPADLSERLEFVARHRPALERDEVRHNVLLMVLDRIAAGDNARRWTMGEPGACAAQTPPFPIILSDLSQAQCRALAEQTRTLDYPAVVGPDRTANRFASRADELGVAFLEPVPQQIHALSASPRYPGTPGHARPVELDEAALLLDWTIAFLREAMPHEAPPDHEKIVKIVAEARTTFWIVDGAPVSMAAISRRLRHAAAISAVYTPPALRGRGYAGSVVAAVVERIYAEGRSTACLYTDLRNPFSNRCYAKIGFKPVCESWHIPRAAPRNA